MDFIPKIFYLIPKKTCSRKYHEYYFDISLSFSQDFKICDKHPGIYFFFSKKNRLSHLTLLNGCPCKIEKHTRILSQCEYDIIFVLEYLNLKIFAEKNQHFLSLYFLQAQSLVAISLVLKMSSRFFSLQTHLLLFRNRSL